MIENDGNAASVHKENGNGLENRNNFCSGYDCCSTANQNIRPKFKHILRVVVVSQYLADHPHRRGGLGSFFIRWFENKDRDSEQRRANIKNHCTTLIQHYKSFTKTGVIQESSLQENLCRFPYWRHLREHLYTGHRTTYDKLNEALQTNRAFKELSNDQNYNLFKSQMYELIIGHDLA